MEFCCWIAICCTKATDAASAFGAPVPQMSQVSRGAPDSGSQTLTNVHMLQRHGGVRSSASLLLLVKSTKFSMSDLDLDYSYRFLG